MVEVHFSKTENIVFSELSERESQEIYGDSCSVCLDEASENSELSFYVKEDGDIVSIGHITDNKELVMFTSKENHTLTYIKSAITMFREYVLVNGAITTQTSCWYKSSIRLLKAIGFRLLDKDAFGVETWVLEPKQ